MLRSTHLLPWNDTPSCLLSDPIHDCFNGVKGTEAVLDVSMTT
jgi:hypothetical protein